MSINYHPFSKDDVNYSKTVELYVEAFPEYPRIPVWLLQYKVKKGTAAFDILYDNDTWIGLLYTTTYKDIVFVQLLAISPTCRSSGYGSKVLDSLRDNNVGKRIILNIEELDEQAENNKQRIRRKTFYEKNGFTSSGYIVNEYGERYEMLILGGKISKEEIDATYKNFLGFFLGFLFKPEIFDIWLNVFVKPLITRRSNGQKRVGYFHSVQYFSQHVFAA